MSETSRLIENYSLLISSSFVEVGNLFEPKVRRNVLWVQECIDGNLERLRLESFPEDWDWGFENFRDETIILTRRIEHAQRPEIRSHLHLLCSAMDWCRFVSGPYKPNDAW